jgi:hypothetical protein
MAATDILMDKREWFIAGNSEMPIFINQEENELTFLGYWLFVENMMSVHILTSTKLTREVTGGRMQTEVKSVLKPKKAPMQQGLVLEKDNVPGVPNPA